MNQLTTLFIGHRGKHIWPFFVIIALAAIAAFFEGASFGLMLMALSVLGGEPPSLKSFGWLETPQLLNFMASFSPHDFFIFCILLAIGSQVFRSCITFFDQYLTVLLTLKIQSKVQEAVYRQIFRLSFPCVSHYKVGDLTDYARAPATVIPVVMDAICKLFVSLFMVLALIGMMYLLSPSLTLTMVLFFGVFGFLQRFIIGKVSRYSQKFSDELVELSKHTVQSLQGIRAIFTFHRQEGVLKKTLETLDLIAQSIKRLNLWNQSANGVSEVLGVLFVGLCFIMGTIILEGKNLLPMLLTFMTLSHRLSGRVQNTVNSVGLIAVNYGLLERVKKILEPSDKEFSPLGGVKYTPIKDQIEFQSVSLLYPGREVEALSNVSMTIPKGQVTAIIGSSGAGKSSLIDLLLRLYEPTSGQIFIDQTQLSCIDVSSWRGALGVVSQDTFIFNETIEENIRFGWMMATLGDVLEAAKAAGAHEFISRLPETYDTIVGERGYRLSGGERQRIALARALLRKPDILILDEATSNLDSHSESIIQNALEQFRRNGTIIVIAHRLSTIKEADQIIVLDQGKVVEVGSHKELMEYDQIYASFCRLQNVSLSGGIL